MKNQDDLKNQMVLLSLQIENCKCSETKTRLLNRARALLASYGNSKKRDARAQIERLSASLPLVYVKNPHALVMIEEKQPGFEKFLPHFSDLQRGARMKNQIEALASQFKIEIPKVKSTHTKKERKCQDKKLSGKRTKRFSTNKFETIKHLNSTIDDKEVSPEMRRQFARGKKDFVKRETEFNGTRRNDKPTNTTQSWNEEGKKIASAKGAR